MLPKNEVTALLCEKCDKVQDKVTQNENDGTEVNSEPKSKMLRLLNALMPTEDLHSALETEEVRRYMAHTATNE